MATCVSFPMRVIHLNRMKSPCTITVLQNSSCLLLSGQFAKSLGTILLVVNSQF